ncbi:MAG: hypothetical protein K0S53_908 [Bacteroidetes bacterium]|nr:hypothetical protein [Bacteroidota bacterium]
MTLFGVLACKKKVEEAPDVGYDYAPVTLGKYIVYDVDSTVYTDIGDTIYNKYRIKEKLEENFTDNQGREAVKLARYIKKYNDTVGYDNIPWVLKDVWNLVKTSTTLEVVEEDVRLTKLIFPVREDATWNGNAQNTMGEWEYLYKYIDKKENINGATFDNVLFVEQKDDKSKNAIHRQYFIEKHAKNVGLVYREIKDLYSNHITIVNGGASPVETRIEKGIIYKQTYVTHGTE